jgi:exonuclease VII large subunit
MDPDPIEQLQNLLADRDKVLEKISSIHSALGSLRADSAAPEPVSPPASIAQPHKTANPQFEAQGANRLLQCLHDMQAQIEERVRPLAQQAVDNEVARLHEETSHQQASLRDCLAQIDRCIVNCIAQIETYRNQQTILSNLNERIAQLGATPEPLPSSLSLENFSGAIHARIDELRERGKF